MTGTLLSFGHGYSAQALSRLLAPLGWRIIGTTRDPARAEAIRASGAEPMIWPGPQGSSRHGETGGGCSPDPGDVLARATHLLISTAPDEQGDPVLARCAEAIAAAAPFQWTGYLSTTGVYGDHGGGWVDETTPLTPTTTRGRHRVLAEAQWRDLAEKAPLALHVFRLAGIYGPGRGPFAKVRAGTARRIVKPGQVFSRIHVDDIARVLAASIARPRPGAVYNVCDNDPAPPEDVLAHAAELLGLPVPPAEPWDSARMTPMARSFYAESKRVRNNLIREELGVDLLYPDYRVGLAALLAETGGDRRSETNL